MRIVLKEHPQWKTFDDVQNKIKSQILTSNINSTKCSIKENNKYGEIKNEWKRI